MGGLVSKNKNTEQNTMPYAESPLAQAINKTNFSLVKQLLDEGHDPHKLVCYRKGYLYETCLNLAIKKFLCNGGYHNKKDDYLEIIKLLLQYKTNPNLLDAHGCNALHTLFSEPTRYLRSDNLNSRIEIAEWLIKSGLDLLATDKKGNTALHALLDYDNNRVDSLYIFLFLLEKGISLNPKNNEYKTPLEWQHFIHERRKNENVPRLKMFMLMLANGAEFDNVNVRVGFEIKEGRNYENIEGDKCQYLYAKLIEFCKLAKKQNDKFQFGHGFVA